MLNLMLFLDVFFNYYETSFSAKTVYLRESGTARIIFRILKFTEKYMEK